MRFKRKIELGRVFDSVKKLPADVVRQNISNTGGPEASRYLLDLCAHCRHGLGLLKTKASLSSLQPSSNSPDLKIIIYLLNKRENSASTD